MDDLPEVNDGDMAARIAEHVDATGEQVATCLTIEEEFMAAVGIMRTEANDPWPYRYYPLAERLAMVGAPQVVDTKVLGEDCERLAGVPAAIAWEVYVVESALLCGEDPRSML